jgi:teichuronic acid biosynthesis glycosyltransferase TuaC
MTPELRILLVSPIYPGPDAPRAGLFVHRQAVQLAAAGATVRVLVPRPAPPRLVRRLLSRSWLRHDLRRPFWPRRPDGIPVATVFYPRRWTPGEDVVPAMAEALAVAVRPGDFDVVYAHWLWPGGAAALALGRTLGLPVAAIARGSEMHDWHAVHPTSRAYVERVLAEADLLLANCAALRERAEALLPGAGARMEVVYNGCDATAFQPAADRAALRHRLGRRLGIDPEERLLVFCGALTPRKGLPELAEAWRAFAPSHPAWRLLLIGGGKRPDGFGERAVFTGELAPARVLAWLQAADGYVQPSRLEGLANATMEAMAVALPVVATAACGQAELVAPGQNGWLVPTEDPAALAAALAELAADPVEARRRGEAARRTIVERFDPRAHAVRLAGLLAATGRAGR